VAARPDHVVPEFSRPISVARLGRDREPAVHQIAATAEERAGLARRFDLLALDAFEAEVSLRRVQGGDIRLDARLGAKVVQACVVTAEPVPATITDEFSLTYRPGIDEDEADRLSLALEDDEIIEPLVDDLIDIGEAVAQQLALCVDPYPKVPGVEFDFPSDTGGDATEPEGPLAGPNPFAVLGGFKKRQ
jgi:hypothetical protein